jgi:hypothetical protein
MTLGVPAKLGNPGRGLALVLALACAPAMALAQDGSVGFWETPAARQAAMLTRVPASNAARLATLRRYFADLGCTGDDLRDQAVGAAANPADPLSQAGNLLCTLHGQYRIPIVVAAWYPDRPGGAAHGWANAVALPMLYHALQAEERHFTFIFAELGNASGERAFLDSIRSRRRMSPYALVALDAFGLGNPRFFTAPRKVTAWHNRGVRDDLEAEAWHIAQIQGVAREQQAANAADTPDPAVFPNDLLEGARGVPRVLLYSGGNAPAHPDAYRQDVDFAAFYLAAIDVQLDPLEYTP